MVSFVHLSRHPSDAWKLSQPSSSAKTDKALQIKLWLWEWFQTQECFGFGRLKDAYGMLCQNLIRGDSHPDLVHRSFVLFDF